MNSHLVRACIVAAVGLLTAFGIFLIGQSSIAQAQTEAKQPLDCLGCHPRQMQYHDKLGLGNKACWVCHDSTDMKILHMPDGDTLTLDNSAPLCGQCHSARYQAWLDGTHGFPVADPNAPKPQCSACHHQHAPQVVFADITLPHPSPQPTPNQPSAGLLFLLGAASVLLASLGIVLVKGR